MNYRDVVQVGPVKPASPVNLVVIAMVSLERACFFSGTYLRSDMNDSSPETKRKAGLGKNSKDYERYFDTKAYLRNRFSGANLDVGRGEDPNKVQPLTFQIRCFHEFYAKYHRKWTSTDARLLEFGGGPVIYPLISAAPFVSEIVFADYAEVCCNEVQLWRDKDPSAHDWSPFFEYVSTLDAWGESRGKKDNAPAMEEQLRGRFVSVISCDLTQDHPVDPKWGKFDILSSSYCLESVCQTKGEFESALKKLGELLKVGGYIAILISLETTWYKVGVGENEFHQLHMTTFDVLAALENVGLTIEMLLHQEMPQNEYNDCRKKGFFIARKK